MATYTVQGPSGKTYTIEGPEGATADQLGQHILSQSRDERVAVQTQQDRETYDPTKGNNFVQNALIGTGKGMTSVMRALTGPALAEKLGLPGTKEEADRLDAPLMNTAGGKAGNALGQIAAVAPAVLVPGANTYAGATALGGILGAATTEGDLGERAKGAAFGALGGAAGKGAGDLIGAGANKLADLARTGAATRQAANAGKDAAAKGAMEAGYVLPPTEIKPSAINSALEGLSGKIKTSQAASTKNQTVTNNLTRDALGLPKDAPITVDALKSIRSQAGQAYDAVSSAGTITPGQAYADALDAIVKPYVQAAKSFPNGKTSPILAEIEALKTPQFDAASAVSKIKTLRADADAAYGAGDKELGKALKSGAAALEDAIDAHLTSSGAPAGVLQAFRDARQTIAKTYSVEKALNPTTGDISAKVLAGDLKRGRPLSGELLDVAKAGQAFPKATQTLDQNYNAVSPLDYMASAVGASTGNPLAALAMLARPGVRGTILSQPYQRLAASRIGYQPNRLAELVAAGAGGPNRLAPVAGLSLVPANQK